MIILDGKSVSEKILLDIKSKIEGMSKKPHLAVILVGDDSASHIYVKKGVVYTLSNGVTSQEELTSSSSELFINSYKVQEIVLKAIKFYDEAEFYNALEVVSYENGVCKYKLNLNAYNGTKVNAVGKESIELNVTYDEKEIVAIEFVSQKIGSTDSVKVEFKGLGKPSIAYPDDLSSYGK